MPGAPARSWPSDAARAAQGRKVAVRLVTLRTAAKPDLRHFDLPHFDLPDFDLADFDSPRLCTIALTIASSDASERDAHLRANHARLSATATNEAPSTMVVVATTIATTRVQAKILDCSKVTRLTTRAKRRVRMNNSLRSAQPPAATRRALLFSSRKDPITHFRQKKDSKFPRKT
jgi:hypothetical protein